MSIDDIIKSGAKNVTIAVGTDDLMVFAKTIAEQTRQGVVRELAEARDEVYYSTDRVMEMLDVSKQTLWRWEKRDYLIPIKVGTLSRYRKSDIDKLLNRK